MQRISAVIMLFYGVFMLIFLITHQPLFFTDWQNLFKMPAMRVFTLLFALSLFAHAWVGVRDILMDYVHATWLRLTLHVGCILALISYAILTGALLWS